MNLHVLESQIRGLRHTADDLFAEFNRAIQPSARSSSPDEEDRFVAAVLVMPILRALAAELSLKAISIKRFGKFQKTHDLRALYEALDDDTRNRIEQRAAAKRMDPVRETLTKHRTDFVDWRYAGEDKALNTNPSDLDEAVEILMAVYEEDHLLWPAGRHETTREETRMAAIRTKNLYVIRLSKSHDGKSVLDDRRFMARNPHYRHRILFAKPCVYVGQTAHDPEVRFRQHKEGYKASPIAKKYGRHLMKKEYEHLNPVPASEAEKREEALALRLQRKGYAVWWN